MPIVGAPDLERSFATAHAGLALTLFLVPGLIALVVEPMLFLLADRYPRRWFIRGGIAAMAVGVSIGAAASSPLVFSLAIALVWFASGTATGLAEATLVDRFPEQRGRTLARWTLWGLAGDLLAPALLAAVAVAGGSWRIAFAIVGGMLALWSLALLVTRDLDAKAPKPSPGKTDEPDKPDEPTPPLLAALRFALRDRVLVAWLFGMTLCDLLDEILVVFASLHLRVELGASPLWQSAAVASCMIGGALGLAACDILLRKRSERWVLAAAALGTVACYVPWLLAPTPLVSAVLMLPVGACAAPLYPLAAAQAYARRPDASGAVLAAGQLFQPLGLVLPLAIGVVADHAGTALALALLVVQPLGLVTLVAATRATRRTSAAPDRSSRSTP